MRKNEAVARFAIDSELAGWHRLYIAFGEAERRLVQARTELPSTSSALLDLEAQVAHLKRRSDDALDGVHAVLRSRAGQRELPLRPGE